MDIEDLGQIPNLTVRRQAPIHIRGKKPKLSKTTGPQFNVPAVEIAPPKKPDLTIEEQEPVVVQPTHPSVPPLEPGTPEKDDKKFKPPKSPKKEEDEKKFKPQKSPKKTYRSRIPAPGQQKPIVITGPTVGAPAISAGRGAAAPQKVVQVIKKVTQKGKDSGFAKLKKIYNNLKKQRFGELGDDKKESSDDYKKQLKESKLTKKEQTSKLAEFRKKHSSFIKKYKRQFVAVSNLVDEAHTKKLISILQKPFRKD
jgi:hypothetical protein